MKKILIALTIAASAAGAWADGLQSLEAFVRDVKSGRADFTQTVTAPSREGRSSPESELASVTEVPTMSAMTAPKAMSRKLPVMRRARRGRPVGAVSA